MPRRRIAGNCSRLSGAGTRFIWGPYSQMRLIQKRAAITTTIYGNCRLSKWNHNRTELQNLKSTWQKKEIFPSGRVSRKFAKKLGRIYQKGNFSTLYTPKTHISVFQKYTFFIFH